MAGSGSSSVARAGRSSAVSPSGKRKRSACPVEDPSRVPPSRATQSSQPVSSRPSARSGPISSAPAGTGVLPSSAARCVKERCSPSVSAARRPTTRPPRSAGGTAALSVPGASGHVAEPDPLEAAVGRAHRQRQHDARAGAARAHGDRRGAGRELDAGRGPRRRDGDARRERARALVRIARAPAPQPGDGVRLDADQRRADRLGPGPGAVTARRTTGWASTPGASDS